MKLLLVLLACIAVANAAVYYKSYSYPKSACYRFVVKVPSTWCSSKYYSPILKAYPSSKCGKSGWRETSVYNVVKNIKNVLKRSRTMMIRKLYAQKWAYVRSLCAIHNRYKANYKKFLNRYYSYRYRCITISRRKLDAEKKRKIKAYNKKLDQLKFKAISRFQTVIYKKISMITRYHKKIVKGAEKCLNTRLMKIRAYKYSLDKKIRSWVSKFSKRFTAIAYKNKMHYKKTLSKLFAGDSDWWIGYKANRNVYHYYYRELAKVRRLTSAYYYKLRSFQRKLVSRYTCSYRCYFSNSCLRFARRSYYKSCRSYGLWMRYKVNYRSSRTYLRPFHYRYCFPRFRVGKCKTKKSNLKTIITRMKEQTKTIITKTTRKFFTLKNKWIGLALSYKNRYNKIMIKRHSYLVRQRRSQYLCFNGKLTYAQRMKLAKYARDLRTKRIKACNKYYGSLFSQITKCVTKFNASVRKYKKRVSALITRITKSHEKCMSKRKSRIAAYKKKLQASVRKQRAKLYKNSWDAKVKHWHKFNAMLIKLHGQGRRGSGTTYYYPLGYILYMARCYATVLVGRCNTLMSRFDSHWSRAVSKLVSYYACRSTCRVRSYCVPRFSYSAFFRWKLTLPRTKCYTYRIKTYKRRCYYRIKKYKKRYTYCY